MNRNSRLVWLPVLLLVMLALPMSSCWLPADSAVLVSKDCMLVDVNGNALKWLTLEPGRRVLWCNNSPHFAIIVFTNHKIAGGVESIRLAPGECVTRTVGTYHKRFTWQLLCFKTVDGIRLKTPGDPTEATSGDGGPPNPTTPPPPPPPGG